MKLALHDARRFTREYGDILHSLTSESERKSLNSYCDELFLGRSKLVKDPTLLQKALYDLKQQSISISTDVVLAASTLEVGHWLYLRDAKDHSIFVNKALNKAFAVLGLTDTVRAVVKKPGSTFQSGMMCFRDNFIYDGLVSHIFPLNKNIIDQLSKKFSEIKKDGRFYTRLSECPKMDHIFI